ncbi:MAG: nucleotidyltransferase domain-containing protein [Ignavibacteria bacterium]|nr:nucleotidyltransferase domain-containing protein [Ignavibacteria bacterium]
MNTQTQNQINQLLAHVKSDGEILAAILFGSQVADSQENPNDVDICLVVSGDGRNSVRLSEKRLEYLKVFGLDIHIYQQLPLYIRQRVLREGRVLYCQDEDQLYEIAFMTIRELASFEHVYRYYLEEVADARP